MIEPPDPIFARSVPSSISEDSPWALASPTATHLENRLALGLRHTSARFHTIWSSREAGGPHPLDLLSPRPFGPWGREETMF